MKIAVLIARNLLGLLFLTFGLNGFLHFIPTPPPAGLAGQYLGVLFVSHYLVAVFLLQLVAGALLLVNRFVPVALVLLGPVLVNILLFHLTLAPAGIGPGALAAILEIILLYAYRDSFKGVLSAKG